jgi:hypothetical protein
MWNNHFLIVIYHSSLVKGAMNAARVCKLRNGVKKSLNFFFFQWSKVNQVCSEYSPQLYGIAWSEIFIEPPPYAQQRRRRGERGTGVTKGS